MYKDTSPTSGGSSPVLNAPLLMRNINEYNNINIIIKNNDVMTIA